MIKQEESRHDFAFMAGVVIGAVTGALVTLALAPRTGTETRERWRARVDEMPIDDLRARATTLREAATSGTERLREAASEATTSGVVETTRSRVTELVDRSPLPVTLGHDPETLADVAGEAEDRLTEELAGGASESDALEDDVASAVSSVADDEEDSRT